MTKVTMTVQITGRRNGVRWPGPGSTIDVPAAEAETLVSNGYATSAGKGAQSEPSGDVETKVPAKKKPAAKRAAR